MKLNPSYSSATSTSAGREVGALPQHGGRVAAGHRREVVELVPATAGRGARCRRPRSAPAAGAGRARRRRATRSRRWSRRPARRSRRGTAARRSCGRRGSRRASSGRGRWPSGCSAALRRALSAIWPSCSRVVPNSWKWRMRHHRDPVGGRRRAERQRPLHEAAHARRPGLGLRLPRRRASPTSGPCRPAPTPPRRCGSRARGSPGRRRPRQSGVDHRAELARRLEPAGEPVEVEPQRVLHLVTPTPENPGGMSMLPG